MGSTQFAGTTAAAAALYNHVDLAAAFGAELPCPPSVSSSEFAPACFNPNCGILKVPPRRCRVTRRPCMPRIKPPALANEGGEATLTRVVFCTTATQAENERIQLTTYGTPPVRGGALQASYVDRSYFVSGGRPGSAAAVGRGTRAAVVELVLLVLERDPHFSRSRQRRRVEVRHQSRRRHACA